MMDTGDGSQASLKQLHPDGSLSKSKLEQMRKLPTHQIVDSLAPGKTTSLKTRPDGTILDGNHRIKVLQERKFDVDALPREVLNKY